jgi:hypothetical protein
VYISQLIWHVRAFSVHEGFSKRGKLLTNKLTLQGYNEFRSKLSFCKFYGRYQDLVCDCKLSLAHMLDDLFHTICSTVIPILALTTDKPVYLISTKGKRRVWPVSRGCLLLRGTWSYLCIFRRSVLPYSRFCNCLLDYGYILHIANFSVLYDMLERVCPSFISRCYIASGFAPINVWW